jgi:hypothetical protein
MLHQPTQSPSHLNGTSLSKEQGFSYLFETELKVIPLRADVSYDQNQHQRIFELMEEIGEKRMLLRRCRLIRPELFEPCLSFLCRVAGALPFEESRAFRRWVSTSRLVRINNRRNCWMTAHPETIRCERLKAPQHAQLSACGKCWTCPLHSFADKSSVTPKWRLGPLDGC